MGKAALRSLFMLAAGSIFAGDLPYPEGDERNYYIYNILPKEKHPLSDTLFEKTVWRRKVSHLVLETAGNKNRVTLLMMERYPWNYKGQNYPIYFEFDDFQTAFVKYTELDKFLDSSGVMRVKLQGAKIIEEKILYPGHP